MLAIRSLVPLHFLNPACTSVNSQFMHCWSLTWRILSITLLACEMSAIAQYFEHSLALAFGIGMKTESFLSCGHSECFTFAGILKEILYQHHLLGFWNSSAKIPSPPLALFIVMLPKAHLTSHSTMSGSSWVITSSWLSGSLRSFFCIVLLCILATSS